MLIYANSLDDLEDYAFPIGQFLARRGLLLTIVGSDRAPRHILGRYFPTRLPLYYKGLDKPRGTDLAYTDAALFGI